jgi:DNA-binding SARP family transcriptional activator
MNTVSELANLHQNTLDNPALPDMHYKACLFGPFHVMRDDQLLGEPVWRRNKARTLLKWFLLNPGTFFSVDQLNKVCWPDIEQTVASKNLHVTIHYLRRLLEPDLESGQKSAFIRRNRHNFYWFHLDECWWVDVLDIEQLSMGAKEADLCGNFAVAIPSYQKLADYYNLGFLPEEVYEDVFSPYRRQYDCAYAQILERLMQLCTQIKMFDDVLIYGRQALAVDPYCEAAVKAIANVYLEQENLAGAIHVLDTFRDFLWQELAIAPSRDFLALRENILCDY